MTEMDADFYEHDSDVTPIRGKKILSNTTTTQATPSWLSGLREEWISEIGAMTVEKRKWFLSQNPHMKASVDSMSSIIIPSETVSSKSSNSDLLADFDSTDLDPSTFHSPLPSSFSSVPSDSPLFSPGHSPEKSPAQRKKERISAVRSESITSVPSISSSFGKDVTVPITTRPAQTSNWKTVPTANAISSSRKIAVLDTSKAVGITSYLSSFFGNSQPDAVLVNDSNTYLLSVRHSVSLHEERLSVLQKERKAIRSKMIKETERWDKYALETLAGLARTLFETQLLQNSASVEITNHIIGALSNQLNKLQNIIETKAFKDGFLNVDPSDTDLIVVVKTIGGNPVLLEPEKFPNYLIENVPHIKELHESIISFSGILDHLKYQYNELQLKSLTVERKVDRSKRYYDFFHGIFNRKENESEESRSSSGLYFHKPEIENVSVFRQLIFDQRQWEGMSIFRFQQKLVDALSTLPVVGMGVDTVSNNQQPPHLVGKSNPKDTPNKSNRNSTLSSKSISNSSVHSFIMALEDALRMKYSINAEWFNGSQLYIGSCAQLCLERQIYPKLSEAGVWPSRFVTQFEKQSDLYFHTQQVPWLMTLAPRHLGIEPEYFSPFHEIVPILNFENTFSNNVEFTQILPHITISSFSKKITKSIDKYCPLCNEKSVSGCFMTGDNDALSKSSHIVKKHLERSSSCCSDATKSGDIENLNSKRSGWWLIRRSVGSMYDNSSKFPFFDAIKCLSRLSDICVPLDMLHCILQTIRLISAEAKLNCIKWRRANRLSKNFSSIQKSCCFEYCSLHHFPIISPQCCTCVRDCDLSLDSEESREVDSREIVIDADTLFPLVVFVVLHARVPLYSCFGLIERSIGSTSALHFGEIGLCVTLIEAALHHLAKLEPGHCTLASYIPKLVNIIDSSLESDSFNASQNETVSPYSKVHSSFAVYFPFEMNSVPPTADNVTLVNNISLGISHIDLNLSSRSLSEENNLNLTEVTVALHDSNIDVPCISEDTNLVLNENRNLDVTVSFENLKEENSTAELECYFNKSIEEDKINLSSVDNSESCVASCIVSNINAENCDIDQAIRDESLMENIPASNLPEASMLLPIENISYPEGNVAHGSEAAPVVLLNANDSLVSDQFSCQNSEKLETEVGDKDNATINESFIQSVSHENSENCSSSGIGFETEIGKLPDNTNYVHVENPFHSNCKDDANIDILTTESANDSNNLETNNVSVCDSSLNSVITTDLISKNDPYIIEHEVTLEVTKYEVKPEVTKYEVKPEVTKDEVKPEVTKDEVKPEVTKDEVKPEVTKYEVFIEEMSTSPETFTDPNIVVVRNTSPDLLVANIDSEIAENKEPVVLIGKQATVANFTPPAPVRYSFQPSSNVRSSSTSVTERSTRRYSGASTPFLVDSIPTPATNEKKNEKDALNLSASSHVLSHLL